MHFFSISWGALSNRILDTIECHPLKTLKELRVAIIVLLSSWYYRQATKDLVLVREKFKSHSVNRWWLLWKEGIRARNKVMSERLLWFAHRIFFLGPENSQHSSAYSRISQNEFESFLGRAHIVNYLHKATFPNEIYFIRVIESNLHA